jgi:predicted ribosome quality control (RQC) complex YloA/Tae2 family protein
VVQPEPHAVALGTPRGWLLVSVEARLGRIHLLDGKPPGTGEAAPAFCMLLRKQLVGARLAGCAAVEGERAAELSFRRGDETRRLLVFLYGRAAQLVLVDPETEAALGAIGPARQVRTRLPPAREASGESRFASGPGLSARVEAYYKNEAARLGDEEARTRSEAAERAERKRLLRLEARLVEDLERARAAGEKRGWADLLLANLKRVPRGAASVTLTGFDGARVEIPLRPDKSPSANAQKLHADAKRLSRAAAVIEGRLAEVRRKLAAPLELPVRGSSVRSATKKPGKKPPYHEFKSARGVPILVGRGADRNDELTFKVARGNDLWMHTRDVAGAHVVVPLQPGRAVDEETLADAATLAAHHSSARGEAQVDVAYCLRKHVRKPKGARPGTVTTAETKTLRVRLEAERLSRLLATRVES